MAANGYVGEGVLAEILSRLPVKSLLRFRCVSKSWKTLVQSSYFVSKHYIRQCHPDNNNLIFLVTSRSYSPRPLTSLSLVQVTKNNTNTFEDVVVVKDGDDHQFEDAVPSLATLKQLFLSQFPDKILGPVNGVYCVICYPHKRNGDRKNTRIYLCNPSLRHIRTLPDVPEVPGAIWVMSSVGFGYDSASIINDFKVVLYIISKLGQPSVFIHTLNSVWRQINTSNIILPFWVADDSLFLKHHGNSGVIHWLAGPTQILSFDLGTEVFSHTSLPSPSTDSKFLIFRIHHVKESLIVILKAHESFLRSDKWEENMIDYQVWKMEDYCGTGVKGSWSRLHNIGPIYYRGENLHDFDLSIYFLQNKDMLCYTKYFEDGSNELVLYDPGRRQQFKCSHIDFGRVLYMNTYQESLVSLS